MLTLYDLFLGKAKWEAWTALDDMTNDDAMKAYISLVDELSADQSQESTESPDKMESKFESLAVNVSDGVCSITLNRPTKKECDQFKGNFLLMVAVSVRRVSLRFLH